MEGKALAKEGQEQKQKHQGHLGQGDQVDKIISLCFIRPSNQVGKDGSHHGPDGQNQQKYISFHSDTSYTSPVATIYNAWISGAEHTPNSSINAQRTRSGAFIYQFGSST